jgi:AcrR family transcriptional regulator
MSAKKALKEPGTREHILSVATHLFSENGFTSVSIRDICEAAGVTPPTIYYYFKNKDKLFQEVICGALSLDDFWESLVNVVNKQTEPQAKLQVFIQHYLGSFPRDFFNPGMFLQASTQIYTTSTKRVMDEFQEIHALASKIINLGIQKHVFRKVDIAQTTEYLMTTLLAYVLVEVHYYQSFDLEKSALFIMDIFLNGLSL